MKENKEKFFFFLIFREHFFFFYIEKEKLTDKRDNNLIQTTKTQPRKVLNLSSPCSDTLHRIPSNHHNSNNFCDLMEAEVQPCLNDKSIPFIVFTKFM